MNSTLISTFLVSVVLLNASAMGQDAKHDGAKDETCAGPVYARKAVSSPARFKPPDVVMTKEAHAKGQKSRVILSGVLCRTGHVTDIVVSKGSPAVMTERVVEALRLLKFMPAEKDGQVVSQAVKFDFRFSFIGERRPLAKGPPEGRWIDSVEVGGYREELKDEIDACMRLLSGQRYNKKQIERVWRMLLESGDFDKGTSTFRIEEGDLGGLGVVFEMKERPKTLNPK